MDPVTLALSRGYTDEVFGGGGGTGEAGIWYLYDKTTGEKYTLGIENGLLYYEKVEE